jgi:hypothetical protein
VFTEIENGTDVRMVECGYSSGFALEPFHSLPISGEFFGEDFYRDEPFEPQIPRSIDDTHPASPELFENAIVGNRLTSHFFLVPILWSATRVVQREWLSVSCNDTHKKETKKTSIQFLSSAQP